MNSIKIRLTIFILVFTNCICFGQTEVMSFNIRYDNPNDGENRWEFRKNEVVELLKYYKPDFLGIQEAMPNQSKFIANKLEAYGYIGHGRDGLNTDTESILLFYNKTKFKLLESNVFWLSETPEKASRGWDAKLNRIMVYGVFENKANGETLHIINCHFDHRGEIAREKSAEQLVNFIEKRKLSDENVIVLGDLNCLPSEEPIKILSRYLDDSYDDSHHILYGPIGTYNKFDIEKVLTKRIDYIFTRNIDVKSYRSIDDKRKNNLFPSDHLPILIRL